MRFNDVKGLLEHIDSDLVSIEKLYRNSLRDKNLPPSLPIDVKNLMENLRSCLDYMAQDIYESLVAPYRDKNGLKPVKRVYFPYAKTKTDFDASISRNLPDIETVNPKVYDIIEMIQPYKASTPWLHDLCSIVNANKHNALSPQEKTEHKTYKIGPKGAGASISAPAGAIKAPPGAIRIGGRPVVFDPASGIPLQTPGLDVKVTTWIDFKFVDTDVSVLPLMNNARAAIGKITDDLYAELT